MSARSVQEPRKKYPTIAACGLECGMCPRFYTVGPSRCPGCAGPGFHEKHPTCSFITCCVKERHFEVCSECPEFPCPKFQSAEDYGKMEESSSYPTRKTIMRNLLFIQKQGIGRFMEQQRKRMQILRTMIDHYDDGRSRSFFCREAQLLDLAALSRSIRRARKEVASSATLRKDRKSRAKLLRTILTEASSPT